MGDDDFQASIRRFVLGHLRSVAALDLLLFLYMRRSEAFTVSALAGEMRSNRDHILILVEEFAAKGLVHLTREEAGESRETVTFNLEMESQVREVAEFATVKRYSLIDLIYQSPVDKIRLFSSAFKVRK